MNRAFGKDDLAIVKRVVNRLKRNLPPNVERDDLVQEGCMAAIEALKRYRPGPATRETYVYGRVLNALRGYQREQGRICGYNRTTKTAPVYVAINETELPCEDRTIEQVEAFRDLKRLLSVLSEAEACVIKLCHGVDGAELSIKDIAAELGRSPRRIYQLKVGAEIKLKKEAKIKMMTRAELETEMDAAIREAAEKYGITPDQALAYLQMILLVIRTLHITEDEAIEFCGKPDVACKEGMGRKVANYLTTISTLVDALNVTPIEAEKIAHQVHAKLASLTDEEYAALTDEEIRAFFDLYN